MCAHLYMDQTKIFLIILYVFGSDFYHYLCSCFMFALFFIVLNMFCVEKQVLEFFTTHSRLAKIFVTHLATRQSCNSLCEFIQKLSRLILWLACDSLMTRENFRDSSSRETPRNNLLKSFLWETCFKPLTSFLKPLFQYFYIKTQSIWMIFHSINISKVILNSFLWFWSLDYVLEGFCAPG